MHIRTQRSTTARVDERSPEVRRKIGSHGTVDEIVGLGNSHDMRGDSSVESGAVEQATAINGEVLAFADIARHPEPNTHGSAGNKLRHRLDRGRFDVGKQGVLDAVVGQAAVEEKGGETGVGGSGIGRGRAANGRNGRRGRPPRRRDSSSRGRGSGGGHGRRCRRCRWRWLAPDADTRLRGQEVRKRGEASETGTNDNPRDTMNGCDELMHVTALDTNVLSITGEVTTRRRGGRTKVTHDVPSVFSLTPVEIQLNAFQTLVDLANVVDEVRSSVAVDGTKGGLVGGERPSGL